MGLNYGANYRYYNGYNNPYMQPQISGGDKIGHFAEKNWNRIKTGAAIGAVGTLGITGACIANNINSNATTFRGTFAETFPKITNVLKSIYKYSGAKYCVDSLKASEIAQKFKQEITGGIDKIKNGALEKTKLAPVVDYFKKDGSIGNKIATSLAGLKNTLQKSYANMSGKGKLIAGIGLATLSAIGLIWGAGKYRAGKIDQKYEDRAKFM